MKEYQLIDAISALDEQYLEKYFNMKESLVAERKARSRLPLSKVVMILSAALLFLAGSITVIAAREPLMNFFVKMRQPDSIKGIYAPSEVPIGYYLETQEIGEKSVKMLWCHTETAEMISFSQTVLSEASALQDGWQAAEYMEQTIYYRETGHERFYRWNTSEYSFFLSIPLSIAQEDGIYLIDAIEKKHTFDYAEAIPYDEKYHYYSCTSCDTCDEKRFKRHQFVARNSRWTCEICGYIKSRGNES